MRRHLRSVLVGVSLVSLAGCTTLSLFPAVPEERQSLTEQDLPLDLFPPPGLSVPLTDVTVPAWGDGAEIRERACLAPPYKHLKKSRRLRSKAPTVPSAPIAPVPTAPLLPPPRPPVPPEPSDDQAAFRRASFGPQARETAGAALPPSAPPRRTKAPPVESPEKLMRALNAATLVTPRREWSSGGIIHYPYEPGRTYLILTALDHPAVVFLPPGETLAAELVFDENKFHATYSTQVVEGQRIRAILIKASAPLLPPMAEDGTVLGPVVAPESSTPLLTRSGLSLWLLIRQVKNTSIRGVTWHLPEVVEPLQAPTVSLTAHQSQPLPTLPDIDWERLHRAYTITVSKGKPPWVPVEVFDDGRATFVQFAESLGFTSVPSVYVVHEDGVAARVDWMPYEDPRKPDTKSYYVIGGLWPQIRLVGSPGTEVTITRGPTRRTLSGAQKGSQ